jgi:hypothetical protein
MTNSNTALKDKWSRVVPFAAKAVSSAPAVVEALINATVQADYNRLKIGKEITGVVSETVNKYLYLLEAIEKYEIEELTIILNNDSLTSAEKADLFRLSKEISEQKDIRKNDTVKYVINGTLFTIFMIAAASVGNTAIKQTGSTKRTIAREDTIKSFSPSALATAIKH